MSSSPHSSSHGPQQRGNLSPGLNRLGRVPAVLERVGVTLGSARRLSAVQSTPAVRHRGRLAPAPLSCPRSTSLPFFALVVLPGRSSLGRPAGGHAVRNISLTRRFRPRHQVGHFGLQLRLDFEATTPEQTLGVSTESAACPSRAIRTGCAARYLECVTRRVAAAGATGTVREVRRPRSPSNFRTGSGGSPLAGGGSHTQVGAPMHSRRLFGKRLGEAEAST